MDCPLDDLLHQSDAIFTTTSSTSPIVRTLAANQVIIALGSDDEHKSEVDPNLFSQADMVVVDSKAQAMRFGDVARALKLDIISHNKLVELGQVTKTRASKIIADFSGIGAQDFAIAKCVFSKD
jgi:ornithine cyclodeaminase